MLDLVYTLGLTVNSLVREETVLSAGAIPAIPAHIET